MATQTTKETELAEVKAAISTILAGSQSITSPNGAAMMRANLQTLYDEKNRLEKEINALSNSSSKIRVANIA